MTQLAVALPQRLTVPAPADSSIGGAISNAPSVALDFAGRAAEGLDWVLKLPKGLGGLAQYLPVPGAGWLGSTVGSILSGAFQAMTHASTLGAFKWLQGLRRHEAVAATTSEALVPGSDVGSVTVKSFLSGVKDKMLRNDLQNYFRLSKSLEHTQGNSPDTKVANAELARLELRLSRRGELLELKRLGGLDKELAEQSRQDIEQLADRTASTMISRIEGYYKEKGGMLGSTIDGEWARLASQGESGREALRNKIRDRLLAAYDAERNGENSQQHVAQIKADLGEAFLSKSTFREAGFYAALGLLWYTGTLATVMHGTGEALSWVWGKTASVAQNLLPAGLVETISNGWWYAKALVGGILGVKAAGIGYEAYKHFSGSGDGSHHTATDSIKGIGDGSSHHNAIDAAKSPLDRATADLMERAASHGDSLTHLKGAEGVERLHVDPVPVRPEVPHAEIRAGEMHGHVDPSVAKVHARATPR